MNWLHQVSIWSVLLPAVGGLTTYARLNQVCKWVTWICVGASVPQLIRFFAENTSLRITCYNIYIMVEGALYVALFGSLRPKPGRLGNITTGFAILFLMVYGILVIKEGFAIRFFHEAVCMVNLYATACVLYQAAYRLGQPDDVDTAPSEWWILGGLFFYSVLSTIIYALWPVLYQHSSASTNTLWNIHHISNATMYLFFGVAIAHEAARKVEKRDKRLRNIATTSKG